MEWELPTFSLRFLLPKSINDFFRTFALIAADMPAGPEPIIAISYSSIFLRVLSPCPFVWWYVMIIVYRRMRIFSRWGGLSREFKRCKCENQRYIWTYKHIYNEKFALRKYEKIRTDYEMKVVPSYAAGIYHPPKADIISKIYHPLRSNGYHWKKARRSVRMRRRHFTMRSITSCTEGVLHVPQGTLSFKTGGVSNCGHLWSLHLCIRGRMWSVHRAPTLFDHL